MAAAPLPRPVDPGRALDHATLRWLHPRVFPGRSAIDRSLDDLIALLASWAPDATLSFDDGVWTLRPVLVDGAPSDRSAMLVERSGHGQRLVERAGPARDAEAIRGWARAQVLMSWGLDRDRARQLADGPAEWREQELAALAAPPPALQAHTSLGWSQSWSRRDLEERLEPLVRDRLIAEALDGVPGEPTHGAIAEEVLRHWSPVGFPERAAFSAAGRTWTIVERGDEGPEGPSWLRLTDGQATLDVHHPFRLGHKWADFWRRALRAVLDERWGVRPRAALELLGTDGPSTVGLVDTESLAVSLRTESEGDGESTIMPLAELLDRLTPRPPEVERWLGRRPVTIDTVSDLRLGEAVTLLGAPDRRFVVAATEPSVRLLAPPDGADGRGVDLRLSRREASRRIVAG